ncbi:MAG: phosphodiester glycosidase family protein [Ruminococcaceae bacterium]|nr:phosphodiester glycosidase family protein [Oscillospiraceae bacterium]
MDDYLSDIEEYQQPYEDYDQGEDYEEEPKKKKKKRKRPYRKMRIAAILLSIILFCESVYCVFAFSDIPFCVDLRNMYIDTALDTMSSRWLADYFLPEYIVAEREQVKDSLKLDHYGHNSKRPEPTQPPADQQVQVDSSELTNEPTEPVEEDPREAFYELFWELNRTSFESYLDEHPETLDNGWENIYINEAGLLDRGTSIYTSMGEQVLAIDVPNKLLLVRVQGSGYLGVLAIGKDPAQLRCEASEGIGSYGQKVADIVNNSGGVIGMSANGFYDPNGGGNGGTIAGFAICEGQEYGYHYETYGYKRIELTKDNQMYIIDSNQDVADDVTDACEFEPALIIDGEFTVGGWYDWNANNPRACLGQSETGEILMLVIEGRQIGRSIGTDVETCAYIMKRHKAYNAMNLDGGTSAVMYYNGEYVTQCSNTNIDSRFLPNAWVYGNYE